MKFLHRSATPTEPVHGRTLPPAIDPPKRNPFERPVWRLGIVGAVFSALLAGWGPTRAAEEQIDITKMGGRPTSLYLDGYSGEAARVLRFDLSVMGFDMASAAEQADFIVKGSAGATVEGRLVDRLNESARFARRYTGGNVRALVHALSDDIVLELTGRPGIARTKIAFKGVEGRRSEIYVADYDGANAVAVTRDNALVAAPDWTPDGWTLYYTSYKAGSPDIYSHDLRTGARQTVAGFSGLNTSPAVSPDGSRVAMILSKNGSPDLYVANRDGSGLRQLTSTKEDESSPCWSPDGRTICFTSRQTGLPALYTISPEGGTMRKLRTAGAATATEPTWSPDGRYIAFTVLTRPFQIAIVPAEGGTAVYLTGGEDPNWAPNSRTILFTREIEYRKILSLLDVPTKRVKDINHVLDECAQGSWAP